MGSTTTKTVLISALAAALLVGAAGQSRRLMSMSGDVARVELRDAPPLILFATVVLGGFKGLLADVLWLRASLLQDEGRYFELVQLSDWITKLEPGLSEVWAFHAWNMTYNVSVMMPKAEDRWRWVQNGISLLRDEGILYNPGDPKLYFELGWIFEHKLGQNSDVMHLYYQKQWAEQMAAVVGQNGIMDYDKMTDEQAKDLADKFKLDAAKMKVLDEMFGPLDWRLPEANAVYWGYEGVKAAGEKGYISCDRVVYQSLMQMFRRGRLRFDPGTGDYQTGLNTDLLPGAMKAFEMAIKRHPSDRTVPDSYALFLREAVHSLENAGMGDDARRIFEKVSSEYGDADTAVGYDAFIKSNHHN